MRASGATVVIRFASEAKLVDIKRRFLARPGSDRINTDGQDIDCADIRRGDGICEKGAITDEYNAHYTLWKMHGA